MVAMTTTITTLSLLFWTVCFISADQLSDSDHQALGETSKGGLWEEYKHSHFSSNGTPIVHSFGVEPAFTGRDFFLDFRSRRGDGFHEQEIETELEWAFTRRFGVILEQSYVIEEEGGDTTEGFGNFAIVPRVVLLEESRYILTSQLEIVLPTASKRLGGREMALAPGLAAWFDLGNWWTLNAQVGVEHIFDEDETEFLFGLGLVKTIGCFSSDSASHCQHHPSSEGLFNLLFEVTGSVALSGDEKGEESVEGLIGFSFGLTSQMDLRLGYEYPISTPREFDHSVVGGLIWHF